MIHPVLRVFLEDVRIALFLLVWCTSAVAAHDTPNNKMPIPELVVRGERYTEVVLTHYDQKTVSFSHADGISTLPLSAFDRVNLDRLIPGYSAREAAEKNARAQMGILEPERLAFDMAEPIKDPKTGKPSYRIRLKFYNRRIEPKFVSIGETVEEFTFVAFRRIIPTGIFCTSADDSEADLVVTATGEKFTLTLSRATDLTGVRYQRKQQERGGNVPGARHSYEPPAPSR